jgi:hypothetical protein
MVDLRSPVDGLGMDKAIMIGRLLGWVLVSLAILAASADAVMALGAGAYDGIAAGEVWVLLSGHAIAGVESGGRLGGLAGHLMDLPAWMILGPLGFGLVVACRRRHKRRMFSGQRSAALH